MTNRPDVVAELRAGLIIELTWAGAEATEAVLVAVDAIPYREGDDIHAYLTDAMPVIKAALTTALQPRIQAFQDSITINRARIDLLSAQQERFEREFEAFKRMKTPRIVH